MTKIIKGSCNWCGSCCGFGSYPKPAIPYALFAWDKQHPDLGLSLVKLIKKKIGENAINISNSVAIPETGVVSFYLSKDGLQTSPTDNTCPFFDQTTHACRIWNTKYVPDICKIPGKRVPQIVTDEKKREKWLQDHPNCSFYWEDK